MTPTVPPRPDLPRVTLPAPRSVRRRRRIVFGALIGVVVLVGSVVLATRLTRESCSQIGPAAAPGPIRVVYREGANYCFRIQSSAEGFVTDGIGSEHHRADAVERATLSIEQVMSDGSVRGTLHVVDESETLDGAPVSLRDPFDAWIRLDRYGNVTSPYGYGVPTGTSNGTGLMSVGQFVPVFPETTAPPGVQWTQDVSGAASSDFPVPPPHASFSGTREGDEVIDGHRAIRFDSVLSVPEQKMRIAASVLGSGYPDSATASLYAPASETMQQVWLATDSHELIRMTSSYTGSTEITIDGLDVSDPNRIQKFDGTLTLTIDRID